MREIQERRYLRLRTRLSLSISILASLAVGITLTVMYLNFRQQAFDDLRLRLLNILTIASLDMRANADAHATLQTPADMETDTYRGLNRRAGEVLSVAPEIAHVYTLRSNQQGQIYMVLNVGDLVPGVIRPINPIGTIYQQPSQFLIDNFSFFDRPYVEETFFTNEYGTYISGYSPIFRSDGTREGVFAIDFSADNVLSRLRQSLLITIAVYFASVPIIVAAGWLLGNILAKPIVSLTNAATQVAQGDLTIQVNIQPGSREVDQLSTAFNQMTSRLRELVSSLEQRVVERTEELSRRTNELEKASQQLDQRVKQLDTISTVARSISQVQSLDALLPQITEIISEQFGFYHVGLFLLDDFKQFAVLSASNSPGGKQMLEKGHCLKVGEVGIVGYVAGTGNSRIALSTDFDTTFFNNPYLPTTKSEMALPLKISEETIGVLDVQSTAENAFSSEDISLMETLADQVAIAIQNARSFEETQKALAESELAQRQYLRAGWQQQIRQRSQVGYQYSTRGAQPLEQPLERDEITRAVTTGAMTIKTLPKEKISTLAVPVKLRNEVIGVLNIRIPENHRWTQEEIDIVEAAAERLALSAENARLFEETTKRAARERTVSEITTKIRSANDPETMLQTALNELKQVLGATHVQIVPYAHPPQIPEEEKRS